MMKKTNMLSAFLICAVLVTGKADAQGGDDKELPPGMQAIKIGTAEIIAPKGIKVERVADIVKLETTERYAARKFLEIEARLDALEEREKDLGKEIEKLKTSRPEEEKPAEDFKSL
jgi:hypothetical protein